MTTETDYNDVEIATILSIDLLWIYAGWLSIYFYSLQLNQLNLFFFFLQKTFQHFIRA